MLWGRVCRWGEVGFVHMGQVGVCVEGVQVGVPQTRGPGSGPMARGLWRGPGK